MEYMIGVIFFALPDVYGEVAEILTAEQGHYLVTVRSPLMHDRVALYAHAVQEAGAPMDYCLRFIDCTKMKMCRPGGSVGNHRACYSEHKRFTA